MNIYIKAYLSAGIMLVLLGGLGVLGYQYQQQKLAAQQLTEAKDKGFALIRFSNEHGSHQAVMTKQTAERK